MSTLSLIEPNILWLAFAINKALKCLNNTVSAPNVKKDASGFLCGLVQAGSACSILELGSKCQSAETLVAF